MNNARFWFFVVIVLTLALGATVTIWPGFVHRTISAILIETSPAWYPALQIAAIVFMVWVLLRLVLGPPAAPNRDRRHRPH